MGAAVKPLVECKADGCSRGAIARGVCRAHYDALRAGRPVNGLKPFPVQRELTFPKARKRGAK